MSGPFVYSIGEPPERMPTWGPTLVIRFRGTPQEQQEWCRRLSRLYGERDGLADFFSKVLELAESADPCPRCEAEDRHGCRPCQLHPEVAGG